MPYAGGVQQSMTKEELEAFVKAQYSVSKEWLAIAKRWRETADAVENLDLTLATMLRRQALTIEEYQNRIRAYALTAALDEFDRQYDEREQTINDLFTRTGVSKS